MAVEAGDLSVLQRSEVNASVRATKPQELPVGTELHRFHFGRDLQPLEQPVAGYVEHEHLGGIAQPHGEAPARSIQGEAQRRCGNGVDGLVGGAREQPGADRAVVCGVRQAGSVGGNAEIEERPFRARTQRRGERGGRLGENPRGRAQVPDPECMIGVADCQQVGGDFDPGDLTAERVAELDRLTSHDRTAHDPLTLFHHKNGLESAVEGEALAAVGANGAPAR